GDVQRAQPAPEPAHHPHRRPL
ncbi:MAG: hypothetical protein AVDCRST_MAG60-2507, partial [uncultured Nocardioides sp.]